MSRFVRHRYAFIAPVLCLVMLVTAWGPAAAASSAPTGKIDTALAARLDAGGRADVLIFLNGQADLSGAAYLVDKQAKNDYVYRQVTAFAAASQAALAGELKQRGIPFQAFYTVNMMALRHAGQDLVETLAARDDVRLLSVDARFGIDPLESTSAAPEQSTGPMAIAAGVAAIHAPEVWALGIDGSGIVVAGSDTGVRWTHEALKPQYRGWNGVTADHSVSWHDAIHSNAGSNICGHDSPAPCDDYFHGSHTIGTVAGDNHSATSPQQIGVAPGAKWIACRNMDNGVGTISRYVECNDWLLAPGSNAANAPDVVNNSWSCIATEGCNASTWMQIQPSIQTLEAAGIMFVASAGNSGSACNTMLDPPAVYAESFTVGAVDPSSGTIASFSSRGLRAFTNLFGPDVSAPGTGIVSAWNSSDTAYGTAMGTSMAAPHVVGTVALMWQAYPALRGHVAETKQYLRETATRVANTTCGVLDPYPDPLDGRPTPNNVYGWGRIDALAAVNAVRCPADVDYDGSIDVRDVQLVAEIWNTAPGDARYNARRNLDFSDPAITAADVTAVANLWGTACGGS